MKKRFLLMATIVVGLGLTACSVDASGVEDAASDLEEQINEASDEKEEVEVIPAGATYQCPDDCQNGPSYDVPGPCEGCGKEMEIL